MIPSTLPLVMGKDGLLGRLENARFSAATPGDQVLIRLENGRQVHLPKASLQAQKDGSFFAPFSLQELEETPGNGAAAEAKATLPLVTEELHVDTLPTARQIRGALPRRLPTPLRATVSMTRPASESSKLLVCSQ